MASGVFNLIPINHTSNYLHLTVADSRLDTNVLTTFNNADENSSGFKNFSDGTGRGCSMMYYKNTNINGGMCIVFGYYQANRAKYYKIENQAISASWWL